MQDNPGDAIFAEKKGACGRIKRQTKLIIICNNTAYIAIYCLILQYIAHICTYNFQKHVFGRQQHNNETKKRKACGRTGGFPKLIKSVYAII